MTYLILYVPCCLLLISIIHTTRHDDVKAIAIRTGKDFVKLTAGLAALGFIAFIIG